MSLLTALLTSAPQAEAPAAEVRPAYDLEDDNDETLDEMWAKLETFAGLRRDTRDAVGAAGEH